MLKRRNGYGYSPDWRVQMFAACGQTGVVLEPQLYGDCYRVKYTLNYESDICGIALFHSNWLAPIVDPQNNITDVTAIKLGFPFSNTTVSSGAGKDVQEVNRSKKSELLHAIDEADKCSKHRYMALRALVEDAFK